jgi:uncharacterized protein YecE (DUF72 family)
LEPPIIFFHPSERQRTDYRVAVSAWTDNSPLEQGQFYPRKRMTAEERFWWSSHFFDAVEVSSSFRTIPSAEITARWARRTPSKFLFNVKAHGLLTGHYLDVAGLPETLKKMIPRGQHMRRRVPSTVFGAKARSWAFAELRKALQPLRLVGKLGYVLFQLAPWIKPTDETLSYLSTLRDEVPGAVIAVEFRNHAWFGQHMDDTLRFLAMHGLTYVSIDVPRSRATVPYLPALTSSSAVFRLGTGKGLLDGPQLKTLRVDEKRDDLYSEQELDEIAQAAGALNGKVARVHIVMTSNRRDDQVINGLKLKAMLLGDWYPPDREALIDELDDRRSRVEATRCAGGAVLRR